MLPYQKEESKQSWPFNLFKLKNTEKEELTPPPTRSDNLNSSSDKRYLLKLIELNTLLSDEVSHLHETHLHEISQQKVGSIGIFTIVVAGGLVSFYLATGEIPWVISQLMTIVS